MPFDLFFNEVHHAQVYEIKYRHYNLKRTLPVHLKSMKRQFGINLHSVGKNAQNEPYFCLNATSATV